MMDNTTEQLNIERQNSGLVARDLSYVLYKNRHHLEKREYLSSLLNNEAVFNNESMDYLSRNEKYQRVLQMAARVETLILEHKLNEEDAQLLRMLLGNRTSCSSPTQLHTLMFTKNIKLLFTDQQLIQWNQLLHDHQMIGCYAQTELGHGSNIRGLETTATYIPETDEFEIHSPSLRSIKWWPGALSRTANFAIVYARLILHGRDYGVHNFMTQIRDLNTHERLPGITTGDIGAKIGFNSVDNGYCKFDHVRIPRTNMAMRFATVDRNGKYTKQKDIPQEILYFTMLQTRLEFVMMSAIVLAKASTISIRYSAVRQQGYDATKPKSKVELPVLDYQTQMYRLFPLLAAAYAITLTANHMDAFRLELFTQIQAGNVALLNVGHAMSCALKVAATDIACGGLEQARRACGGHGYLMSSGIPTILCDSLQTVTAEGENHMLSLQTARSLLKALQGYRMGMPISKEMEFMAKIDQKCAHVQPRIKNEWLQPHAYLQAFEKRFLFGLRNLEQRVSTATSIAGGVQTDSVASYQLSMAYAKYLLVASFVATVETPVTFSTEPLSSSLPLEIVRLLCHLFALTQLEIDSGSFMECGAVHPQDLSVIRASISDLLVQIRPHAVVLVDAFNFSDCELNSALGRFNGRPYEALYKSAQLDPVNQASDKIMLHEFLLPIRNFSKL